MSACIAHACIPKEAGKGCRKQQRQAARMCRQLLKRQLVGVEACARRQLGRRAGAAAAGSAWARPGHLNEHARGGSLCCVRAGAVPQFFRRKYGARRGPWPGAGRLLSTAQTNISRSLHWYIQLIPFHAQLSSSRQAVHADTSMVMHACTCICPMQEDFSKDSGVRQGQRVVY